MLDLVRKKFFNEEYEKLMASQEIRPTPEGPNHLRSVTILASQKSDSLNDVNACVSKFRKNGIKAYGYLIVQDPSIENKTKIGLLSRKDASWYGVPDQNVLIMWLSRKTDVLIAINKYQDLFMQYLIAASNSRLKSSLDFGNLPRDRNIDFYVSVDKNHKVDLLKDCRLIYNSLHQLGILQE